MTREKLKELIMSLNGLIEFGYNGKYGNVEKCFDCKTKTYNYLLFFDGEEITSDNANDICDAPFIEGKSIIDVAEYIEI